MSMTRRELLAKAGTGAAAIGIGLPASAVRPRPQARGPVAISSGNGIRATERAMEGVKNGEDGLDAAIAGVNIVELDPNDMSVGYGGLPNEDGVVQLDSCVMHGPRGLAGAVAALENIKTPSQVARTVMNRTDHVLLVADGALEFARMHGFEEHDLLTDRAREAWVRWKESLSTEDDYIPPTEPEGEELETHGTITCLVRDAKGDLFGVTTTSGLSYKMPGRVGDSPIIGAGLYVDNTAGAAGSTGRGEACILVGGTRLTCELMRQGSSPTEACLETLQRVCEMTVDPRLISSPGKPNFNLNFYAVNRDGEYGAAAIYKGGTFTVHDGDSNQSLNSAWVHETR